MGIQLVDAPGPLRAIHHQPRPLQDLQVLGDGGPTDRELTGEFANGLRTVGQPLEDRAPRLITQCAPGIESVIIH